LITVSNEEDVPQLSHFTLQEMLKFFCRYHLNGNVEESHEEMMSGTNGCIDFTVIDAAVTQFQDFIRQKSFALLNGAILTSFGTGCQAWCRVWP
jgi:hypothetical protein